MNRSEPQLTAIDWFIQDLAGRSIVTGSQPTLCFHESGRVSGNTSCNRIIGKYRRHANALSFGELATTRKLCSESLMSQEHALLALLRSVTHMAFDESGSLLLQTDDKQIIRACR